MAQFSRRTVLAAADALADLCSHAGIDRFALEHGLEGITGVGSKIVRTNALARHLIENPELVNEDRENLTATVVSALVRQAIDASKHGYPAGFHYETFKEKYPDLDRGLERDSFTVENGDLRRTLPDALGLPQADDEVHALLDHYGFVIPKGHLDQAIAAHARGDWAAANAQFRPFVESLFDEIAARLNHSRAGLPAAGQPRRQWLAQTNPPFFIAGLNEWTGQGTGFIEGFYRRLHPQGAHPGLSDEEDSTFRLHLVLVVARLLLRRLHGIAP
jgi:hypothetical protein